MFAKLIGRVVADVRYVIGWALFAVALSGWKVGR